MTVNYAERGLLTKLSLGGIVRSRRISKSNTPADRGPCARLLPSRQEPTGRCLRGSSNQSEFDIPKPEPTQIDAGQKERPTARSADASSAILPDTSTATSTAPPQQNWGLTGYRSFIGATPGAYLSSEAGVCTGVNETGEWFRGAPPGFPAG